MITVFDVADYFLAKTDPELGDLMTHMKLQKLVYYAQGFNLALYNEPLFSEPIEAWQHGPVCPQLHQYYKDHGSSEIKPVKDLEEVSKLFTKEQLELLDEVYTVYGCFAAWYLRQLTHQDTAWHNNYPFGTISCNAMKESCSSRLET